MDEDHQMTKVIWNIHCTSLGESPARLKKSGQTILA